MEDSPHIQRFECLAHLTKRLKTNLFKRQEKVLKLTRADKAAKSRELSRKGHSKQHIRKELDPQFHGTLHRSTATREGWDSSKGKEIRHLSLAHCGQIASYYRLAVQRHTGDIPSIINAINAIPLHLSANDENAEEHHRLCPFPADSWCRYQSAKFKKELLPRHPNYLGEDAYDLILGLYNDFGYNTLELVEKIADGRTSNYNEAIHSVHWTMVHKTDTVGIDVMQLGSALAVIRFNEGYNGVKRLIEKLGVEVGQLLTETFSFFDTVRTRQNSRIPLQQQRRFFKKQHRSRSQSKKLKKHGPGYSSGSFGPEKSQVYSEDSGEDGGDDVIQPEPIPATSTATSDNIDHCHVCKGTEENRLVGIGLGIKFVDNEVNWLECDGCDRWYHLLCIDVEDPDDLGEQWFCNLCV